MSLSFIPHPDDTGKGSYEERIEVLMEGAERYKASILDVAAQSTEKKIHAPHDLRMAFNWDAIAGLVREIRKLPEATRDDKMRKGHLLVKMAEVYEVLRAAKMPKLESTRVTLINEAGHLGVKNH